MDESDMTFEQRPQTMRLLLEGDSPAVRGQEQSKTFRRRSANLNIQKSLQILDESVASPRTFRSGLTSSLSRHSPRASQSSGASILPRTPGGSLRYTSYAPKSVDVSTILGPTPSKTPQRPGSTNQSMSFSQYPGHNLSGWEEVTEDITTTNIGLLLEEDPGILGCRGLFQDFMQIMKANPSDTQPFNLLHEYESVCHEQVTLLKKTFRGATRDSISQQKYALLHLLNEERNTWNLVKSLFKDQLRTEQREAIDEEDMNVDQIPFNKSDKENVDALFDKQAKVRSCQCVIDWLENCAQESINHYRENVHFFSDRAVACENTLSKLKKKECGISFGSERPMVDEMDPDAPVRQNKLLDDLDKDDERRLLQTLFLCLRGGKVDEAQEICRTHGQSWRAATLEGWRLHHDPNFSNVTEDGSLAPIQGNMYRDIWKSVCWNMAQEPKFDIHEKAMYGVLSGNLRAILPACKSWSDHLWAHFKVAVDVWVEQEIRLQQSTPRTMENLPQEYWDQFTDSDNIFKKIESYEDVRSESQEWYHVIQKLIILGNIEELLEIMTQWIHTDRANLNTHLIRFMAHLVLFLRNTRPGFMEDYVNVILETYVEELIQGNNKLLVAHYTSTLPPDSQVMWCAKFLEGVTEAEEKQQCLELAREAGLNIPAITKTVVENIRSHDVVDFTQDLQTINTAINQEDRKKIESIDWLVFDSYQRSEAIKQANAIMRSFVAVKKLTAAKEVLNKLPPDSIDIVVEVWVRQTGTTELSPEDNNCLREFICHKAYLDAMDSFNDWFNTYHHTKPTKPTVLHGATFTEKVAHEHRVKQYEADMDRWHHNLISQTRMTKKKMYNVLLFTDGGWMVDQKEEEDLDGNRQQQMMSLRQLVLPGLCFLLHNILHTSQQYAECLQLADIIASEQHQLYKVFRNDELRQLLKLLRDSSLAVLDQNKDTLGYDLD